MLNRQIKREVKFEAELDHHFPKEIASRPEGEQLMGCIQCGTCSATCPLSTYMDYTPRRIIAMTRAGFKEEALNSFTIWLCASCYLCTVECPKEIRITDVMYILKQYAIQEKHYKKRFPIPILSKAFFKIVEKSGRNSEGKLLFILYMKTNPIQLLKRFRMGIKLWSKGRIKLSSDSIIERKQLKTILSAVDKYKQPEMKTEVTV
jgi:heterodisulfide reductase subunit C